MFKDSHGNLVSREAVIFPIITFDPQSKIFTCLGTGFFVHPYGGFVTAKHVFINNDGTNQPTLYGLQSLEDGRRIVRSLVHIATHPDADIAIGMLGNAVNDTDFNRQPVAVSALPLCFDRLNIGDEISTYAFPNTTNEWLDDNHQEFTFQGIESRGIIEDYHSEGMSILRNACYQTSMKIDGGASGGPAMKGVKVHAVNSTGMDLGDGTGYSGLTPVSLLLDLSLPVNGQLMSVSEMVERGFIASM